MAAGALGALTWLAVRYRSNAYFYYQLFKARRDADRFYRGCPTLIRDLAPHPALKTRLDIYQPAGARGCPVLIYVYGGSWNSGNKELYAPMAQRLLPEGLVVVIPDYSLYPAARFPRPVREIAAAIAWTLDNVQHYGGDPRRVVVAAQSAGAQIAATALLDPRWLGEYGHNGAEVGGFFGISGVYDVAAEARFTRRFGGYVANVMGGAGNFAAASPITHVTAAAPPAMLIHGDVDTTVPMSLSVAFHERLVAAGVPSEFIGYRGAGHSSILFEALAQNPARLITDLLRFVRAQTGPIPASAARSLAQTPPAGPGHPDPATAA